MSKASWELSNSCKKKCIKALSKELTSLRGKAGISQGDLSKMIGISRQTYSSIETENREMSWNTFLALILFYDYNVDTHDMIRNIGAFPDELLKVFNHGDAMAYPMSKGIAGIPENITSKLDDAAFQAIRTAVMLEYSRCTQLSGEAVIKSFDGINIYNPNTNEKAAKALKAIKDKKKNDK